VPDGPILGTLPSGVLAALRTPEPGQLYKHHLERLAWMDEMWLTMDCAERSQPLI
jgi:membrane dipeptidase